MKSAFVCAFLVSAAMGLTACNNESQKQTEAQAAEELAKAKADAEAKAADKSVGAVADAAVVEAEGETKVALAKCEALDGDAQKQCKDQANAHLATVKERAKAAKAE